MMRFLMNLQWWHWWIVAAIIAAAETLVPGAVVIWFAVSAAVVGTLMLAFDISWQLQLILFAALGFAALMTWLRYKRANPDSYELPQLNQRAAQYIGQTSVLTEAIVQGRGKARIGDGVWVVKGPDLPQGAKVKVVAADGAMLVVESA